MAYSKVTVKMETDKTRLAALIQSGVDKMIPAVAEQALADCNYYARKDQGTMIASSQTASNLPKGELVWNTPYAKKVYFTGTPSLDKNPNASLMWCQVAERKYKKDWKKIAQKAFSEGMG